MMCDKRTILRVSCEGPVPETPLLTRAGIPFCDELELDREDGVEQAYRREQYWQHAQSGQHGRSAGRQFRVRARYESSQRVYAVSAVLVNHDPRQPYSEMLSSAMAIATLRLKRAPRGVICFRCVASGFWAIWPVYVYYPAWLGARSASAE